MSVEDKITELERENKKLRKDLDGIKRKNLGSGIMSGIATVAKGIVPKGFVHPDKTIGNLDWYVPNGIGKIGANKKLRKHKLF